MSDANKFVAFVLCVFALGALVGVVDGMLFSERILLRECTLELKPQVQPQQSRKLLLTCEGA